MPSVINDQSDGPRKPTLLGAAAIAFIAILAGLVLAAAATTIAGYLFDWLGYR